MFKQKMWQRIKSKNTGSVDLFHGFYKNLRQAMLPQFIQKQGDDLKTGLWCMLMIAFGLKMEISIYTSQQK